MSNVYLIKGNDTFSITKLLQEMKFSFEKEGYVTKEPEEEEQLDNYLSSSPFFGKFLVLFKNFEFKDKNIKDKVSNSKNIFIFVTKQKDTPFDKIKNKIDLTLPTAYKMSEYAEAFCRKILKTTKLNYDEKIVKSLSLKCNHNLQDIYFEIQKLEMLANFDNKIDLSLDSLLLKEEHDNFKIIEAFLLRNKNKLLPLLTKLTKDNVFLLNELLIKNILNNIKYISCYNHLNNDDMVVSELGLNKWFFINKIKPVITKWKEKELVAILNMCLELKISLYKECSNPEVNISTLLLGRI